MPLSLSCGQAEKSSEWRHVQNRIQGIRGLTSLCQKCDAKQPCTACVTWDKGVGCTYEPRKRPRLAGAKPLPVSQGDSAPGPSGTHTSPPGTSANGFPKPPTNPPPGPLPLARYGPSGSAPSIPSSLTPRERPSTQTSRLPWELSPRIYNHLVPDPSSDVSAAQGVHDTTAPRLAVSSFTILPSIYFHIPRPLRVPLSFFSPEHVQVSHTAGNDLDMTLYGFFLNSLGRVD